MPLRDSTRSTILGLLALGGCYQGAGAASQAEGAEGAETSTGGVDDMPSTDEDVGRMALHRLTRVEYENTLRDLFGVTFADAEFIRGGTGAGFANQADLLRDIPADLAEGYIVHARDVAAQVFAAPDARARVVTCTPGGADDAECVRGIITSFGQRAWRRPLEEAEIDRLEGRYHDAVEVGATVDEALALLVRMFLGSPHFVFHVEIDPDPADLTPHRLGAYELANRLSYALWNSMPDDALFAAAADGTILEDDPLLEQTERMLDDPRAVQFRRSFLESWVRLPLLDAQSSLIDVGAYPSWSPELGQDMRAEIEAYLQEFTDAEAPWSEFLTMDLNFVTPRLAAHYGMPAPDDGNMRVEDHPDERVGFLGLAGFLTYTSRGDRTAPTLRGKIVLESLQCIALSVPPGVPELEPVDGAETEFPSIRERLEQHRASPDCAGCHNLLDPIGLALENFDVIGQWRDTYENGHVIDATADYQGTPIEGLEQLAHSVAADPTFLHCPTEKLLSYALRRTPRGDDLDLRDRLDEAWAAGSIRELVALVVTSDAFRFRRGEVDEEGT
jgi:hypothetical protein